MTRFRLPARRASDHLEFEHGDTAQTFVATWSRDEGGRLREVFLTARKHESTMDFLARDAAIAASLALQFGAPPTVLAAALTRLGDGEPAGPLGRALAEILEGDEPPPPTAPAGLDRMEVARRLYETYFPLRERRKRSASEWAGLSPQSREVWARLADVALALHAPPPPPAGRWRRLARRLAAALFPAWTERNHG